MTSTTYVQFIKGTLLVVLCAVITVLILLRGVNTNPRENSAKAGEVMRRGVEAASILEAPGQSVVPPDSGWTGTPYVRVRDAATGLVRVWRRDADGRLSETQTLTVVPGGGKPANGLPQGRQADQGDLRPVGYASKLPGGVEKTGALGPGSNPAETM